MIIERAICEQANKEPNRYAEFKVTPVHDINVS